MSKINKFFVVVLLVAGIFCLAIGTAFAVDFVEDHPDTFGCDMQRPVVASNRPLVQPLVEPPMMDVVSVEDFDVVFQTIVLHDFSNLGAGRYSVSLADSYVSFARFGSLNDGVDSISYSILGFSGVDTIDIPFSSFVLCNTLFQDFAVDTSSQDIYLTPVDGSSEITASYTLSGVGVVYLEVFDSFAVYDADDQVLGSTSAGAFIRGLFISASNILDPIITTLVSGLRALGTNVGRAFSTIAESIFINADSTGLSTFGILVVVFAAVSLGLSLTRWVLNFCGSWGKRNR